MVSDAFVNAVLLARSITVRFTVYGLVWGGSHTWGHEVGAFSAADAFRQKVRFLNELLPALLTFQT